MLPIHLFLTFFFGSSCLICKKPARGVCKDCLCVLPPAESIEHSHMYALFEYGNTSVQKILWELKYRRNHIPAKALALYACDTVLEIISECFQPHNGTFSEKIVFVPIPQYKKKNSRGFNQAQCIASWWAPHIGASVEQLLEKTRNTTPQSHIKEKALREKNVQGVFSVPKQSLEKVTSDVLYIIIDDVITTGATARDAIRALKTAGAQKVLSISLAHGYKKH